MRNKIKDKGYKIQITPDYFAYRNYSKKFDKRLLMDFESSESNPVQMFIDDIYSELGIKAANVNKKQKKEAMNNTITNVLVSTQEGKVLALPRTKEIYTNSSTYGLDYYTHTNIVGGTDALIKVDYLNNRKGFYEREKKKGEFSRVWATKKLLDELNCFAEIPLLKSKDDNEPCRIHYLFGKKLSRRRLTNPIVLKDKDKNEIPCPTSKNVFSMRLFLESYNQFIDENSINLPEYVFLNRTVIPIDTRYQSVSDAIQGYVSGSTLPLLSQREVKCLNYIKLDGWLYRVFNNGKFTEGGRFYGGEYLSLNEDDRSRILINNNKVVEADYSALHPRMIYHLEKIDYKGDPYTAVSAVSELRTPIKKMMQIIINAATLREAIFAFNDYLNDEPELKEMLFREGLDERELAKMIIRTHKRIEKYFNTGIGVQLQYRDSKIAERILKHFTKKKIVCLCVHDSFIVEEQYLDELIEVMRREYKKEIGFDCELKVNR